MLDQIPFAWFQPDVPGVEPAAFRTAMRQLVGGVCVVTVGAGRTRGGFTATSVTSLSADPPMVLVCVNRGSSSYPVLLRERAFGINVLRADHQELADRFAGAGGLANEDRYAGARWQTLSTGVSVLADALAVIDCEVEDVIERASHGVVFGRVRSLASDTSGAALAYWRGGYTQVGWTEEEASIAAGLRPY